MKSTMFYEEPVPARASGTQIAPDITRIVANNPSKMTYHGTNTFVVETSSGTFVIDPGPVEDAAHLAAIVASLGDNPAGILLTHHHSDHFGAAPALREATRMPVYVSNAFPDDAFEPDGVLRDGEVIGGLTALHTPGHASDHLCFARPDGVLFTGDHVMAWNSSIVNPPDGNMSDYVAQLSRLIAREDATYLPGHGPRLDDPKPYVRRLLGNRERRETEILTHLAQSPDTVEGIAASVYNKSDPMIARAAERNVIAHLEKLVDETRVVQDGDLWRALN